MKNKNILIPCVILSIIYSILLVDTFSVADNCISKTLLGDCKSSTEKRMEIVCSQFPEQICYIKEALIQGARPQLTVEAQCWEAVKHYQDCLI